MNQVTGKSTNGKLHAFVVALEYNDFWQDWQVVFRTLDDCHVIRWNEFSTDISWWKFAANESADCIERNQDWLARLP